MSAISTGSVPSRTGGATTHRIAWWGSPALRRRVIDLAFVGAMLVVGALAWGPVFGSSVGYLAAGGGAATGLVVAILAAWRRWTWLVTLLAATLAYLALGGLFALPSTAAGGVLPSVETLQQLTVLSWQSWRDLLTVAAPAGEFEGPAVLPYLVGLATATIATSSALRASRLEIAVPATLVATATFLVVGILWGSHQAPVAVLEGAVLAAAGVGWTSWRHQLTDPSATAIFRSSVSRRGPRTRQVVAAGTSLTLAAALSALAWSVLAPDPDRQVLRDAVHPPLRIQDYPSPLTEFRHLELDLEDETLFTVEGLPEGTRVRLAAMDLYDGNVYAVTEQSEKFQRTGETIAPGEFSAPGARTTHLTFDIGAYDGVWVPGGGDIRHAEFDDAGAADSFYYNAATGTALATAGVADGDHYALDVALAPIFDADAKKSLPSEARVASFPIPPVEVSVDSVGIARETMQGNATTPMDQLRAIEGALQQGAYANGAKDNPSLAGHTAGRLTRLLDEEWAPMAGDDEQYAVAMALMARDLGLPARVVMGFYPEWDTTSAREPVAITGDDAHVWVEVLFEDLGWVNFDPTPDENNTPQQRQQQPEPKQQPQVLPPPEVPEDHDLQPPPRKDSDEKTDPAEEGCRICTIAKIVAIVVGGGLLTVGPFAAIAALKTRRRRRRRTSGRLVDRISGGWAEVLDLGTDLGLVVPAPATRFEAAMLLEDRMPPSTTVPIAHRVDAHVFGAGEPTEVDVEAVWAAVDRLRSEFRQSATLRDRIRQRFSLRSLVQRPYRLARAELRMTSGGSR